MNADEIRAKIEGLHAAVNILNGEIEALKIELEKAEYDERDEPEFSDGMDDCVDDQNGMSEYRFGAGDPEPDSHLEEQYENEQFAQDNDVFDQGPYDGE